MISSHSPQSETALAQAIVDTVREPLLVLDKELRVIAASRSFYETFQVDRQETQGRLLYTLGDGQWDIPALRSLLGKIVPDGSVLEAFEVEHEFPKVGRRIMLLNARTVISQSNAHTALLLAIEDISERRETERELQHLLRQKELLLEEMQHRIANSLQIIASILLMKARTVQSEETRGHLQDAHKRVMSVAAVQQHLQASGRGEAIAIDPPPKLVQTLAQLNSVAHLLVRQSTFAPRQSTTAILSLMLGLTASSVRACGTFANEHNGTRHHPLAEHRALTLLVTPSGESMIDEWDYLTDSSPRRIVDHSRRVPSLPGDTGRQARAHGPGASSNPSCAVWDVNTGRICGELPSPTVEISPLVTTRVGDLIVGGCSDGNVYVWELRHSETRAHATRPRLGNAQYRYFA